MFIFKFYYNFHHSLCLWALLVVFYPNSHKWANENPHSLVRSHQGKLSLNVWGGIIGEHILGPIFLLQPLNGEHLCDVGICSSCTTGFHHILVLSQDIN